MNNILSVIITKIILLLVIFSSCSPPERINPDDPRSPYYKAPKYTLSIETSNTAAMLDSENEVKRIVSALSEDGDVIMEVEKTFWGSVYGNFIDKFGIPWGIEYALDRED